MYELMHASLIRLARKNEEAMARELRHRRVWLWGVGSRRKVARPAEEPVSVDGEDAQAADEVADAAPRVSRRKAVLTLLRLSME